jgi:hypothetical protein
MRLRKPIEQQIPTIQTVLPFQIYQPLNPDGTPTGDFTFQIRGGLIGYRSQYWMGTLSGWDFEQAMEADCTDGLNGVAVFANSAAANPIPPMPFVAQVTLANATDTLIWDGAGTFGASQIVLNSTPDSLDTIQAAFWIKIIDDPDLGIYPQLWGRMWTNDPVDPTGRPTTPYPNTEGVNQSIIRLGNLFQVYDFDVGPGGLPGWSINQYQLGNLVNRYAALAPLSAPFATPNNIRGYWLANSLSGEVFYDGDLVIDDSIIIVTALSDGQNFYGVYVYTHGFNIETASPAANGYNWTRISVIIL